MKDRLVNVSVGLLASTLTLVAASAGEAPDWWRAKSEVSRDLTHSDLTQLVSEARTSETRDGQESMGKLYLFMRAGMEQDASHALKELKAVCPDLDNHQVASIYYTACDDFRAWDTAQRVVEVFADNLSELALGNRLLRHMEEAGWDYDRIDAWLADQPEGVGCFWIKERLAFQARHGRGEALTAELAAGAREHPEDAGRAIAFLEVLSHARPYGAEAQDLAWIADTVHPARATDAECMASLLKALGQPGTAEVFFRQAMETPLTREEVERRVMQYQAFISHEQERVRFAIHAREELARCLLELKRDDEAQEQMETAQTLREEHGLGRNPLLAGTVQGASGARVIEEQIVEDEAERMDDPAYWQERAAYFRGRGEAQQEEAALQKGLALTEPLPIPERRGKGYADMRSRALSMYARYLKRAQRDADAVALLRKELEAAPLNSASSAAAARLLAYDFPEHLDVKDDMLWTWLAGQPTWEHPGERLLWRLLESADRDSLDRHFMRAEALIEGAAPSRAYTLGWIMNRMGFPARSIPLLEQARTGAAEAEDRERAGFALFESYLDTGQWEEAEQRFPEARKRLTAREIPRWHGRIAVVAAESGDRADALRIWKDVVRASPTEIDGLDRLVRLGLADELRVFYQELSKSMPNSSAPAKALEVVGASKI